MTYPMGLNWELVEQRREGMGVLKLPSIHWSQTYLKWGEISISLKLFFVYFYKGI